MKRLSEKRLFKLLHHKWDKRTLTRMAVLCEQYVFKGCFSRIDIEGLGEVKKKVRAGTRLIFVPNHQSEYDWLILQDRLFRERIRTAIQAGDNLFIGPLEPLLKKCGAFMSIRKEWHYYSSNWVLAMILRLLGTKPIVVSKEQYTRLYPKQLQRILGEEGYNLLVFPGYETDPFSGEVKYGRSYSGEFNPLTPHTFSVVSRVLRDIGVSEAEYIPVNITYERVPEDILFREFKANTRPRKIAKYIYDHYYTFVKAPFSKELHQAKSRVCVRFGAGVPASFDGKAKEFAQYMHARIGELVRVYESMIVFSSLNNRFSISKKELKQNIQENLARLEALHIDCSPLYNHQGKLCSLDSMLNRIATLFNQPKIPIIALKSYLTLEHDHNEVFIHHPHLAAYYGNKLRFLLQQASL